jgi:dTDP-4-amino-4,6-dideoxygalactose transaminase
MSKQSQIYVTKPDLPPLDEFISSLEDIWSSRLLTNGGPYHQKFEEELCHFLGVKHLSLFTNATIALVTALKALDIEGEVITTPYSFVATSHSLLWNKLEPVFVDIDPVTLNLDPTKIEPALTPRTTAIMPVHCYGRPCDVDAIKQIADANKLKVIYDAAHAFGVKCHCGSVLNHGDLSVLSFHATKAFNTFEGGAIISHDIEMKKHIDQLKNFGFVDEVTVLATGINGKMSELNAALGLLQLKYYDNSMSRRRMIDTRYRDGLDKILGIKCLNADNPAATNYSYFPIIIDSTYPLSRDELYYKLKDNNINARRYFFPLIPEFPMYRGLKSALRDNYPVAYNVASKVLCLPIYSTLEPTVQARIINLISEA